MSIAALCGKHVDVVISGNAFFQGTLIESGKDILVLFDSQRYIYIPLLHVHRINLSPIINDNFSDPSEAFLAKDTQSISFRTILTNAKGLFTEIYVTGNKSLHGYIITVRSDYFAFYSPVYKMMLISLHHLKWIIPYNLKTPPYTLSNEKLPVIPSSIPLLRSFEEHLKKWEGELIVFDMGEDPMKIGLVKKVSDAIIEFVIASGETIYLKLSHIKSAHLP
ncbi:DUF2642 domain-containing protein [Bacillus sp. 165]|uniref:DUF2642 domain-containing protein n=1 Tax=Bacillus sp. 165 TaxID=1529117 RepID=UPI001ADCD6F8|nr:DUF2642 domain-containing protein [Bacillus sp. 165]MBO9130796.1 DUF2642 domain-containing protein [Bacillus sp. 165]